MIIDCPHERALVTTVIAGHWPEGADAALRAHVDECEVCAEVALIAGSFQAEGTLDRDAVHVPAAGQVWWRAAIRARLEASQRVSRPFSWLFGISVACAVGLAIAIVQLLWSPVQVAWGNAWTFSLGELARLLPAVMSLSPLTITGVLVLLGATACLLLAPLALYFALSDE